MVDIDIKDKWRLILGKTAQEDMPLDGDQEFLSEEGSSRRYTLGDLDQCLDYVYESEMTDGHGGDKKVQGSKEKPRITAANWLNTSKKLFPMGIYEIVQKDALANGRIDALLQDDQFVAQLEPNMELLTSILALKNNLPAKAMENARLLVKKVVDELREHFKLEARRAFYGKRDLNAMPVRTFRNLDMKRIIKANIKHYQQDGGYIIPNQLFFTAKSIRSPMHNIFVVVDQSGSMIDSYAYSAIIASVFASLGCLNTRMVVYSTEVVDYTDYLDDVLELLFKSQLSGGTETCKALSYIERYITEPSKTIVVLISDLYDSEPVKMVSMIKDQIGEGVKYLVLPSLSDTAPNYYQSAANQLASVGANVAVLSPDRLVEYVAQLVRKV